MHSLNRFEANLLTILYAVLGDASMGQLMPKIHRKQEYPGCLSRTTVELVQNALSKGMTHWLASLGGWQTCKFLRNDKPLQGAVWQRTPPKELGLPFSSASLQFLIWLTANDPSEESADPWSAINELTIGDQLLLFRTLQRLQDTEVADRWFRMSGFARLPLVALCYPDRVAQRQRLLVPDFDSHMQEWAMTLECLQPFLAKRWIMLEEDKARITEIERMEKLGATQAALLDAFLTAAAAQRRRDLARFLLVAMQRLVANELPPQQWVRQWIRDLRFDGLRLSERTNVYSAASSFLAIAARLRQWTDECRQIGYFDEGYAAAQLWLADWGRYDGDSVSLRAAAMVRALSV